MTIAAVICWSRLRDSLVRFFLLLLSVVGCCCFCCWCFYVSALRGELRVRRAGCARWLLVHAEEELIRLRIVVRVCVACIGGIGKVNGHLSLYCTGAFLFIDNCSKIYTFFCTCSSVWLCV